MLALLISVHVGVHAPDELVRDDLRLVRQLLDQLRDVAHLWKT